MSSIEAVILLGNGPNRLSKSSISWGDVLNDLMRQTPHLKAESHDKPFPLLFEQIAIHMERTNKGNDGSLKNIIGKKVSTLTPNAVHHRLLKLGVNNVLTTNYDYTLEKAAVAEGLNIFQHNATEKKYSLFRKRTLNNGINVWHMHGEADSPRSITLGYGHYTSYISSLWQHTMGHGTSDFIQGNSTVGKPPHPIAWIDVFLKNNLFIVGLGLGFEEVDLWWAITHKERMRNRFGNKVGKTVFYQFSSDGTVDAKGRSLLDLGIEVVLVEVDGEWDYYKGYMRILSDIHARCNYKKHKKHQDWVYHKKSSATWLAR
ncbi:MAG: SIR2 family protein [Thalassolituus oleivorans]|nr:SIR2 family protein [Thalassolituus oleivorans]